MIFSERRTIKEASFIMKFSFMALIKSGGVMTWLHNFPALGPGKAPGFLTGQQCL